MDPFAQLLGYGKREIDPEVTELSMSATTPPLPAQTIARGIIRSFTVPSCSFTAEDLRRLFQVLEQKAREAADRQVASLQQMPDQTNAQFEQLRTEVRSAMELVVRVQGSTGEWTRANTVEALSDEHLPDSITRVEFDSAFLFRGVAKIDPQNVFILILDFQRTPILDMRALYAEPSLNDSQGTITGSDTTWVNGVYEGLRSFFRERKISRDWLYVRNTYDFLVLLLGFPISFSIVYRVDRLLHPIVGLPEALFVALYVYLVLIALFFFRILFNYAKWVFPKVEGPSRRQGGPKFHKALLIFLALTLLSNLFEMALRLAGFSLR